MNLREFKKAYKELVSDGWQIISNESCIRLEKKGGGSICHCPVTAVAKANTSFRLRKRLGTDVTYKAGWRIGLTRQNVLFIMRCADLSNNELKKFGKRALKLRRFLLNPAT